jgi:hypothetical protein
MPELPTLAARWAPSTTPSQPIAPTVAAYESDLLESYDAFRGRHQLFVRFLSVALGDTWEPWGLPEDGTVRRSSLGPPY